MKHYSKNFFGSIVHVLEYHPSENPSQLVRTPINKRQALEQFTHPYYIDQGFKVIGAVNASFFQTDDLTSIYNGLFARDSGSINGVPNNGHTLWLNKDGTLNIQMLNTVGVKGLGVNWIWGVSLAYQLVKDGKKNIAGVSGFNLSSKVERTAFGQREDKTIVIIAGKALTGEETAEVMLSLQCEKAVMGDGGGSTEMIVNGKAVFPSERPKGTALLIFGKEDAETITPAYRTAHIKARKNTRYKAGQTVKKKYLTIHTTNNYDKTANAEMHRKYLETTANYVSFALVVDEIETIELMPLDEPAYSAGDGGDGEHNVYSIAMEICCHKLDAEGKLDSRVYRNAVETAAKIIVDKKVAMDQHRDVPERTWKNCPNAWILDYKQFALDVNKRIAETTQTPVVTQPVEPKKLYRVQVGAFSKKENAENLLKELKTKGYAAVLKEEVS